MRIYILVLGICLSLINCTVKEGPFSPSLTKTLDYIIKKHPNYKVIQIQASEINGHNLLYVSSLNTYNPNFLDGYFIYKDRLITYFQTDSINRPYIVNRNQLHLFKGSIDKYKNALTSSINSEPIQEIFEIKDKKNIVKIKKHSYLTCNTNEVNNCNIILNKHLERLLTSYICNNPAVLYELRFWQQDKRQYVFWRPMPLYDKDKYDGYFYLGNQLIVLYGTKYSDKLLNGTWIKNERTIPKVRYTIINDWDFPYLLKLEVLRNGSIRIVSTEEGFFVRDNL